MKPRVFNLKFQALGCLAYIHILEIEDLPCCNENKKIKMMKAERKFCSQSDF